MREQLKRNRRKRIAFWATILVALTSAFIFPWYVAAVLAIVAIPLLALPLGAVQLALGAIGIGVVTATSLPLYVPLWLPVGGISFMLVVSLVVYWLNHSQTNDWVKTANWVGIITTIFFVAQALVPV
jgi:hypothetical protein